jgi:hypothetical protein
MGQSDLEIASYLLLHQPREKCAGKLKADDLAEEPKHIHLDSII